MAIRLATSGTNFYSKYVLLELLHHAQALTHLLLRGIRLSTPSSIPIPARKIGTIVIFTRDTLSSNIASPTFNLTIHNW